MPVLLTDNLDRYIVIPLQLGTADWVAEISQLMARCLDPTLLCFQTFKQSCGS